MLPDEALRVREAQPIDSHVRNPLKTQNLSLLLTNVQICGTVACVISNKLATQRRR